MDPTGTEKYPRLPGDAMVHSTTYSLGPGKQPLPIVLPQVDKTEIVPYLTNK